MSEGVFVDDVDYFDDDVADATFLNFFFAHNNGAEQPTPVPVVSSFPECEVTFDEAEFSNFLKEGGWDVTIGAIGQRQMKEHFLWMKRLRAIRFDVKKVLLWMKEKVKKGVWKESTALTKLGGLIGAVKRHATSEEEKQVNSRLISEFKRMLTNEMNKNWESSVKAVDMEVVKEVVKSLFLKGRNEALIFLVLMWFSAQRPGCVIQLKKKEVTVRPEGPISLFLCRGKLAKTLGHPESVWFHLPEDLRAVLISFLSTREQDDFLFPVAQHKRIRREVLEELRAIDQKLETRGLRRGTIQTLASAGATEETRLSFSKHKNRATLRRYEDYGRFTVDWKQVEESKKLQSR